MDQQIRTSPALHGTLAVPADKSICQRAVLLAAFAQGATEISPWPAGDDCQRALALVQQLGASAVLEGARVTVQGRGLDGLRAPDAPLACGESGTTLRLVSGLLAGCPWTTTLEAAPSLARRPMRRIVEPLTQMGATVTGKTGAAQGETYPPLRIQGKRPLRAIRYTLPVASAQVKSAILFAGMAADGPTTVVEPQATRDHTERLLRAFGIVVREAQGAITVMPGTPKSPGRLEVPGDLSSAAFFLIAAACTPGSRVLIERVSLNPRRSDALFAVLKRMGASLTVTPGQGGWEPSGTVEVRGGELRATTVEPSEAAGMIDELPALMAAAACAQGVSRFCGVGELRVKETDRVRSMAQGLARLGATVRLPDPATVEIEGGPLTGASVEGAGDHRTVMSLAVAGLRAQGATVIKGAEAAGKSFPEFFATLAALGAPVGERR